MYRSLAYSIIYLHIRAFIMQYVIVSPRDQSRLESLLRPMRARGIIVLRGERQNENSFLRIYISIALPARNDRFARETLKSRAQLDDVVRCVRRGSYRTKISADFRPTGKNESSINRGEKKVGNIAISLAVDPLCTPELVG